MFGGVLRQNISKGVPKECRHSSPASTAFSAVCARQSARHHQSLLALAREARDDEAEYGDGLKGASAE